MKKIKKLKVNVFVRGVYQKSRTRKYEAMEEEHIRLLDIAEKKFNKNVLVLKHLDFKKVLVYSDIAIIIDATHKRLATLGYTGTAPTQQVGDAVILFDYFMIDHGITCRIEVKLLEFLTKSYFMKGFIESVVAHLNNSIHAMFEDKK